MWLFSLSTLLRSFPHFAHVVCSFLWTIIACSLSNTFLHTVQVRCVAMWLIKRACVVNTLSHVGQTHGLVCSLSTCCINSSWDPNSVLHDLQVKCNVPICVFNLCSLQRVFSQIGHCLGFFELELEFIVLKRMYKGTRWHAYISLRSKLKMTTKLYHPYPSPER